MGEMYISLMPQKAVEISVGGFMWKIVFSSAGKEASFQIARGLERGDLVCAMKIARVEILSACSPQNPRLVWWEDQSGVSDTYPIEIF